HLGAADVHTDGERHAPSPCFLRNSLLGNNLLLHNLLGSGLFSGLLPVIRLRPGHVPHETGHPGGQIPSAGGQTLHHGRIWVSNRGDDLTQWAHATPRTSRGKLRMSVCSECSGSQPRGYEPLGFLTGSPGFREHQAVASTLFLSSLSAVS